MSSTFFGLNISSSGLRAANASLLTTAHNISNVDTPGFSRQEAQQRASEALRLHTTYGCAGAGADTLSIERLRNLYYDYRYRENETCYGKVNKREYYNDLIERYYHDDNGTGFSSLFSRTQVSLQTMMTNASSASKTTYIGAMKNLTEYFNNTSGSLEEMQKSINDEVKLTCDSISAIAEKLVTINEQINTIEMTGARANDLRDRRDLLIDELSSYVSVETKEVKVMDKNDPKRETGVTIYRVYIAGGQMLVEGNSYNKLHVVAREPQERINQSDVDGLYDIKWVASTYKEGNTDYLGTFPIYNQLMGGTLQGLLEIRDGNNNHYFHGKTDGAWQTPVLNPDNNKRYTKVTVPADTIADYLKDMAKCGIYDTSTIKIGARVYHYNSWTYNDDSSYTFNVEVPKEAADETIMQHDILAGEDVKIGSGVNYQGIPYYQSQMNEWIRNYSEKVNEVLVHGYTAKSEAGCLMLTGAVHTDSTYQYSFDQLNNTNKKYSLLTGRNFRVNDALLEDASRLATKKDATEGPSELKNAKALYDLSATTTIYRNATSGEFLKKVQSDIAMNRNNSSTMNKVYTDLRKTIGDQRLSEMGVDNDEEAMNLSKFNRAYVLSSKMLQTFTEIYDRLILQTGV